MATYSSKQYGWKDLSVALAGRIIEGISEVEYTKKQSNDFLYGRGNDPHEIVSGNNEYEGKIKMWQSEVEAMIQDAPGKDLTQLRPDIIVNYAASVGDPIVTDILKNVKFSELKKAFKQGDKNMEIDLPFKFTKLLLQQ
jgi:hypothetical protein